jgi:hypothetical protein
MIVFPNNGGGVTVQLESREPATALSGEHADCLLVLTYAWDGNAHPGNEFWYVAPASYLFSLHSRYSTLTNTCADDKIF